MIEAITLHVAQYDASLISFTEINYRGKEILIT